MALLNLAFLAESTEPLSETMARAGLNTAMGLIIVFLALAFIAIVIWIEGKIFTAIGNRKASPKVVTTEPTVVETVEENLADDGELVAVIMAAIYAYEAENAGEGYVPADGLVVRSIRRR